jgi:phosphate acetyltransferase
LRILLPESDDDRVLAAATEMASNGIGRPSLLQTPGTDTIDIPGVARHSMADLALLEQCTEYLAWRVPDPVEALKSPLMVAAAILGIGRVDAVIAGCAHTTSDVMRVALHCVGAASPDRFVSTRLLMVLPQGVLTYGDCAMNPVPTAEQLATIAIRCADGHRKLMDEIPRVALLSFSTLGSAEHERINVVRNALKLVRLRRPDVLIDGELQLDAALVPSIAERKAPQSEVAGRANVLIFPSLEAANIACKVTEVLAGAQMVGPFTEGLVHPFLDLSRGCQVDDIVDLAAVVCCSA